MIDILLLICIIFSFVVVFSQDVLYSLDINNALYRINYKTGKKMKLSNKLPEYISAQQLSTMNHKTGILYSLMVTSEAPAETYVIAMDVNNNGTIIQKIKIDSLIIEPLAGIGQSINYNYNNDHLYIIGHDKEHINQHSFSLIDIDLTSNNSNIIKPPIITDGNNINDIFNAINGIDNDNHYYYQYFNNIDNGTYLLSYDINNKIMNEIYNLTSIQLETMNYDYINNIFIGLNINSNNTRDLIHFNPFNKTNPFKKL